VQARRQGICLEISGNKFFSFSFSFSVQVWLSVHDVCIAALDISWYMGECVLLLASVHGAEDG
jgi:hypothetical protein